MSQPAEIADYQISKSITGAVRIEYACPRCRASLRSSLSEAGKSDRCPDCQMRFIVPGAAELAAEKARQKEQRDKAHAAQVVESQARLREVEESARRLRIERDRRGRFRATGVPRYSVMDLVAGLLVASAVFAGIAGVIVCIVQVERSPTTAITAVVITAGYVLFCLFQAQLLAAFRDIAINSWHVRRLLERQERDKPLDTNHEQ